MVGDLFVWAKRRGWLVVLGGILSVLLVLQIASARIYLNEIEINPPGDDHNHEWIEIYNDGQTVNVSGWYIKDRQNANYSFPDVLVEDFFVLDNLDGLINNNQEIKLYNRAGELIDWTNEFDDISNDQQTFSRLPDGENFVLADGTKGLPNLQISFSNLSTSDSCVFVGESVILSGRVFGTCIENVTFMIQSGGEWNYVAGEFFQEGYRAQIGQGILEHGETNWKLRVTNCAGQEIDSELVNFYVYAHTTVRVNPSEPDGENGWYVHKPTFTLENPDAGNLYYQWDSGNNASYLGPFKLETAPNNANVTGGILDLYYWSDICSETHQKSVFYFDFWSPEIRELSPAANSVVYDEPRPVISALINELYGGNSGVNSSSVRMYIDGLEVAPASEPLSGGDVDVSYQAAENLSYEEHEVKIEAYDYAGHFVSKEWNFRLATMSDLMLQIHSPNFAFNDSRRIKFNISATQPVDILGFIDLNDPSPRFKRLCTNCEGYGFDRNREVVFNDGAHRVQVEGRKGTHVITALAEFIIDTKKPTIRSVSPSRGLVNGNFNIVFEEANPDEVVLHIEAENESRTVSVNPDSCELDSQRRVRTCKVFANLEEFHDSLVKYWFSIRDITGAESKSKIYTLLVDSIEPKIEEASFNQSGKIFKLTLNITEENLAQVTYRDSADPKQQEKRLCAKLKKGICLGTVRLTKNGNHTLSFKAYDAAGNIGSPFYLNVSV